MPKVIHLVLFGVGNVGSTLMQHLQLADIVAIINRKNF